MELQLRNIQEIYENSRNGVGVVSLVSKVAVQRAKKEIWTSTTFRDVVGQNSQIIHGSLFVV